MGRHAKILTAAAIKNISEVGLHFVGGVPSLALHVGSGSGRSWILRYRIGGRVREMGLGPYPEVTLSEARNLALDKRLLLRQGIDPIEARIASRGDHKSKPRMLFKEAASRYIASHSNGWKNHKHAVQWQSSLATYANPVIGGIDVATIKIDHILSVLEPIWHTKTETATRLRGRIELVLDWARVRGFREGDNPAAWKGNLDMLLPARGKVSPVKHHAAMEWQHCPEFFAYLCRLNSTASDALRFCILTATRSGEAREARWSEISIERLVWTIPASRMKASKEHRVPLAPETVELLLRQKRFLNEDLVFPSTRGGPLSDMTMLKILRDSGHKFTVHGFRSSFRDWAGETTTYSREVIEHALAHQIKDKTEAAYARGDLFSKRKTLMSDWGQFLSSSPPAKFDRIS